MRSPTRRAKPVEKRRRGECSCYPDAAGDQGRHCPRAERLAFALKGQSAAMRIRRVDRFQLHQRLRVLVGHPDHGAHGGDLADPALAFEERQLFRARLTGDQGEGQVAAQDDPPFRAHAFVSARETELTPAMAATPSAMQAIRT
jgi:hypothetical protein